MSDDQLFNSRGDYVPFGINRLDVERCHLGDWGSNPAEKNISATNGIFKQRSNARYVRRQKERILKKSRHQSQVKPLLKTLNFRGFGE